MDSGRPHAVPCHWILTVCHRTLTDASLCHRSLITAGQRLSAPRCAESLTCTYVQSLVNVQVRALRSSCRLLDLWGRWGQEGLTVETGVTVTLLSHSAHTPSFRATWCFPECGSPMTIVGYVTGSLPDTQ